MHWIGFLAAAPPAKQAAAATGWNWSVFLAAIAGGLIGAGIPAVMTMASWRLRALTAELEALSLKEMARAEGWATITPGTQAPARTKLVRVPKQHITGKTPGDQPV